MKTAQRCPICHAPGEVRSLGAFGYAAHCSECYEGDEEADHWRHLQGHGETVEDAVDKWLEDARELCAVDEIPPLRCACTPAERLVEQVLEQARAEFTAQAEFELVDGWRWSPDCADPNRVQQDVTYLEFPCSC